MSDLTVINPTPSGAGNIPAQASSDAELVRLWLHGRSPQTQRAYKTDTAAFLTYVAKPLRQVTLGDVQAYADSLAAGATASRARRLSSVKSLLSFAHQVGFTVFNVGAPVRLPPVKATLAERILPEDAVLRMLALEPDTRNRVMLRLLYGAGLRISEVASLRWRDAQPRDDAGQITVFGKGGKTRVVRLKASLWLDLIGLRRDAGLEEPVFRSRESRGEGTEFGQRRLDASQVHRIVKAAAARASLPTAVSAHWLRHAHVSHALDRGAPAHLVQATVGHASLATTSRYAHARPSDSSALYLAG